MTLPSLNDYPVMDYERMEADFKRGVFNVICYLSTETYIAAQMLYACGFQATTDYGQGILDGRLSTNLPWPHIARRGSNKLCFYHNDKREAHDIGAQPISFIEFIERYKLSDSTNSDDDMELVNTDYMLAFDSATGAYAP